MTEEVKPVGTEAPAESTPPATDPFEAKAAELGWRPKEEWEGAEEDFIDAKEFVRRKPLFEKIESQNKAIKQLSQAFDALKTHHTRVKEAEYQRALKSLKDAKRQALADGETDRALAYEDKIDEVEQQKAEFDEDVQKVDIPKTPETHPEFIEWKTKNPWYNRDTELREFADTLGLTLARQGMQPAEVLREVASRVRRSFPEKFTNPNRDKPGAVEAPSRKGVSNDSFHMSEEDRAIMKKILRVGGITEAEYIKELRRVQGQ